MQSTTVITPKVEKYPNKPITIIVPFSAGGGTDLMARALEKWASKYLGQSLIVINKPGGTGTIGWNELVSANPDGYTIGITQIDLVLQPIYGSTKYDYPTALEPLAQVATSSIVLAVLADQPWQNIDDLVQYARNHPGQLKFAHGGIGSNNHVLGEMFGKAANITITQVPFNGNGEMAAALLGRHVQRILTNPMTIKEYVKNGTVRVLAVAGTQRMNDPTFSNVPTFKEQGLNVAYSYWYGIAAPKELPNDIKSKLVDGFKTIINEPEFQKNMENLGLDIEYLSPEESQTKWIAESQELNKIVQETGIIDLIKSQKQ
ncbi:Bug family tripartite tricarboxylate transporter substrate binding protein [Pelorhabdus rhamnosifermentans]|uniref:Bug family tripartite tricarboxylate transporter substrate binding protein n=1 Tax=Pelorhabdus rhamnosifermentans TaxID=2772457 RepID=UPI001C062ED5|nr:tripartite tricarboxylate transporter substrate binding protein [Pelorhabdus rhamnosifermentans]